MISNKSTNAFKKISSHPEAQAAFITAMVLPVLILVLSLLFGEILEPFGYTPVTFCLFVAAFAIITKGGSSGTFGMAFVSLFFAGISYLVMLPY
jgi:predicted benzoate:H+ symporter BenE